MALYNQMKTAASITFRRELRSSSFGWPAAAQQRVCYIKVVVFRVQTWMGGFCIWGVFSSLFAGLYRATLRCAHIVYRASLYTHMDAAARGSVPSCLLKRVLTQRFSVLLLLRSAALHILYTP